MGRPCAVPKCKTGYKSVKEKISAFTVPKNPEQFKKWQAAIPGIVLKQSQSVCEKHFEQKCIVKEWVRHDSEGRLMAKIRFIHPRLVEGAVPTIFDNYTTSVPPVSEKPTERISQEDQCSSFKEPLSDAECADALYTIPFVPQEPIQHEGLPLITVRRKSLRVLKKSMKHKVLPVALVHRKSPFVPQEILWQEVLPVAYISQAPPSAPQETIHLEALPLPPVSRATSASLNQKVVDPLSNVCIKNFDLSQVTINDLTSNILNGENNPIAIPTSWGVTEYAEERGQRVVFSHIRRKKPSTIIDKSVDLEADKKLRYCVYGRLIDSERFQLPSVLTDTTLLPKTLEKFRRLNVCQGIGSVNIHHLTVDTVFQDSALRWHDYDCTIIAKLKRCDQCKKMRQRTLRRESRADKTENIQRIRRLPNPIDRKKLINFRKTSSWAPLANYYSKRRVQLLNESLKGKVKEISHSHTETLDNIFLQFQVPEEQTVIEEIVYME